jgi:hypothetical protein
MSEVLTRFFGTDKQLQYQRHDAAGYRSFTSFSRGGRKRQLARLHRVSLPARSHRIKLGSKVGSCLSHYLRPVH